MESDRPKDIIDAKYTVVDETVHPLSPIEVRRVEQRAKLMDRAVDGDRLAAQLLIWDEEGRIDLGEISGRPLNSTQPSAPLRPINSVRPSEGSSLRSRTPRSNLRVSSLKSRPKL